MFVRWGDTYGVKQGGIVSPMFSSLYMDDLSFMLYYSGFKGYIKTYFINHLFYADDLYLYRVF